MFVTTNRVVRFPNCHEASGLGNLLTTNRADISYDNYADDDFVEEPVMMIDFTGSLKEMSKFVLKAVLVACNGNS